MITHVRPAQPSRLAWHRTLPLVIVGLAVLVLAACDPAADAAGAAGADGADDGTAAGEGSRSGDPILDLYQCLRAEGLEVQDPGAGGAVNLDGLDADDPAAQEIVQACAGEHMASSDGRVTVGDGQMGDNLAEPDALIAFVDCLRNEGFDMQDPSPDGRLTLPQDVDPQDRSFQGAAQQCAQQLDGGGLLMGDGSGGGTVGRR